MKSSSVLIEGQLSAGVNYWASHAGTNMWKEWRADIVEKDLAILSEHGVNVLRVFPLWPDFQPVSLLGKYAGNPGEFTGADGVYLAPEADGLDPEMLDRFQILADLAEKYHLKVIVGLLTGWMSGRLFVPPVLERRNLFTDPEALRWESRFIRPLRHGNRAMNATVSPVWKPMISEPLPGIGWISSSVRSGQPILRARFTAACTAAVGPSPAIIGTCSCRANCATA